MSALSQSLRQWVARVVAPELWPDIRARRARVWLGSPVNLRRRRACLGCGQRTLVLSVVGGIRACPDCATALVDALLVKSSEVDRDSR